MYFHIDPSRSAEAALKGVRRCRGRCRSWWSTGYSAYKKLARVLEGRVILAWCWVHQRRDYHRLRRRAGGTERMVSGMVGAHRRDLPAEQDAAVALPSPGSNNRTRRSRTAQRTLETEVKGLFATAERELAGLDDTAPEAGPLRSLLNHRDGLSVFLERPEVPMDNNFAHADIRFMPTTRPKSLINRAMWQNLSA